MTVVRPAAGAALAQAGSLGAGGAGVGTVSRALFRPERAAFSRKAGRAARDPVELHLGQASSARAGLVAKGRKRGVHRQRRERRPLPGMLLHIDGSRHRWLPCRFFRARIVSTSALATWVEDYTSVPMDVFPPHEPRRLCATCASSYSSRPARLRMFNPSERIFSRWQQAKQLSALAGDSKGPSGQLTNRNTAAILFRPHFLNRPKLGEPEGSPG